MNIARTLIKKYKLAPTEIAFRCGISVTAVYNLRNGALPQRNTREKLLALLTEKKGGSDGAKINAYAD